MKKIDVWLRGQAETELVFKLGSEYPVAVICTVYETNRLGEKRLVEQKTLKVVQDD